METTLKKRKNMKPMTMRKETHLYENIDISYKNATYIYLYNNNEFLKVKFSVKIHIERITLSKFPKTR